MQHQRIMGVLKPLSPFFFLLASCGDDTKFSPPDRTCTEAVLQGGCRSGKCVLLAAAGSLSGQGSVTLSERTPPATLAASEFASPVLCEVSLPEGSKVEGPLTLSIDVGTPPADPAFVYLSGGSASLLPGATQSGRYVVGQIPGSGLYGATRRPGAAQVDVTLGGEPPSTADTASFYRRVSASIRSAFWDGERLYVGAVDRILIYRGIPEDPSTRPQVVLGQPDLDTTVGGVNASIAACNSIWSDGKRLVCSNANRVLIWNSIPTRNFTPADVVLGQPDFTNQTANRNGVSASSLSNVGQISSDGTRLLIADQANHRFLLWNTFPKLLGQPADVVISQPNFTSNDRSNPAATLPVYGSSGVVLTANGAFFAGNQDKRVSFVSDLSRSNPPKAFDVITARNGIFNNSLNEPNGLVMVGGRFGILESNLSYRLSMFRQIPTGTTPINYVLGQPDPGRRVFHRMSASTLGLFPAFGAAGPSGGSKLLVPDRSRVLIWDETPTYNFEPASSVWGQPGFSVNDQNVDYRGISMATLAYPEDVAVSLNSVAVADRGNNRVLLFKRAGLTEAIAPTAQVVLGQPDGQSFTANVNGRPTTAQVLSGPAGVALAGGKLIVADTENHRVLIWNSEPGANGAPADLVLGQADMAGRRPNRGRKDDNSDGFSDATADGFFYPSGVASNGTMLAVADRMNHRVLLWRTFPTQNGQPADVTIGQATATDVVANRGRGAFAYGGDGLNLPTGVLFAGADLWIADTENNRVVRYTDLATTPRAIVFVGQPNGSTVANPNVDAASGFILSPTPTATTMLRPRGMAVVGNRLYVSELDSNRVHAFDATTGASQGVLGQSNETAGAPNQGGIGAATLAAPAGLGSDGEVLFVADSANHRVLGYGVASPPGTGAAASYILGQTNFVGLGFNRASASARAPFSAPRGLALHKGELFVADSLFNRVAVFSTPISAGQKFKRIYGQPDDTNSLANSGGVPSARTLSGPTSVAVDDARVVVADTANHRILIYDREATDGAASLVLGQPDFAKVDPNAGGAVSASSLNRPEGILLIGGGLLIADTGNHRVLGWRSVPTRNNQPADFVLGQTSLTSADANGGGTPGAQTLLFPSGLLVAGGALYVADTGNNRVLRWSTVPTQTGAAADGVLGQVDFQSRDVGLGTDLSRLFAPAFLASDGKSVFVGESGRTLAYPMGEGTGAKATTPFGGGSAGLLAESGPLFTTRIYVSRGNAVILVGGISRL